MTLNFISVMLVAVATCLAQAPPAPIAKRTGEKEAKMPDKIDHATAGLAEFSATGNPAGIEKAVDSLEEFDIWSLNPNQRLAARQRLLTSWGLVLMAIDRIKEPGFDPEANTPQSRPPATSNSAALADYERRTASHHVQVLLVELEERAIGAAHRVVERLYTKSGADRKEIEAVFQKTGLSDARRTQIREGLKPTAVQQPQRDLEEGDDE
jgi:hypothetical protein